MSRRLKIVVRRYEACSMTCNSTCQKFIVVCISAPTNAHCRHHKPSSSTDEQNQGTGLGRSEM